MALVVSIILGLIAGWLAFVVGLLIGWAWKPRWVSSPSEDEVKLQCSAPSSFELSLSSSPSPRSVASPLKGFGSASCFKAFVCDTWAMALRQRKTVSPVSSSEQVHVIDGGKKTEERLPNTVTELDLRHLVQLVERKDGGLAWVQMMDQFVPGMRYQAWLREPKNGGPTEYRSRTVFEDATPEVVRDFFWDDEFRPTWDTMLSSSTTVEECSSTGTMIVRWIRKFPFFCSDREYVIGRRIWNCGKSYYCVTKGVSVPSIPRNHKQKRVELFYSSWSIRPVESRRDDGTSACEVLLFHHEDMGIPREIAKLGVKRGMWGAVKKMEPGLRAYQEQRLSGGGYKLSRPALMAQINTKITSEQLVSLSNGASPVTETQVTLDRGNGAENFKKLLFIGGAVAVACTLSGGGGLVPSAFLLGFGKRFVSGGRKRELQGTRTTTT
ncbi:hypothetical protein N665_0014s0115 [Sinapis alba]|nr:hypothetical protein N665_0014s0115 [Sinapis alba]